MTHACMLEVSHLLYKVTRDAYEKFYSSMRDARVDTIRMYDDAVTLVYTRAFVCRAEAVCVSSDSARCCTCI